jgi:hypothetical protein
VGGSRFSVFLTPRIRDVDPGSEMEKKSGPGINILNHISESLLTFFWLRDTYGDPDPGSGDFLTLDPVFTKSRSDPQHWIVASKNTPKLPQFHDMAILCDTPLYLATNLYLCS